MTIRPVEPAQQTAARIAGALYLVILVIATCGWSNARRLRLRVPAAIANFDHQFAFEGAPPREFAERLYDVQRWTEVPRGGHFAPLEEPELLARDISAFFAGRS